MENMKKELLKNGVVVNDVDSENKFFSVSKNGIHGVVSFNDFDIDLEIFLDSVELNSDTCCSCYDVDYIKSSKIDFSKVEENQIKDLILDGFELDYLLTLNSEQLDELFCKYND